MGRAIAFGLVALAAMVIAPARGEAQRASAGGRAGREEVAAQMRAQGDALRAAGDRGSAIGWYRDALSVDPDDALTYERLGRLHLERGSLGDARSAFEAGVGRRPDHAPLWSGLAETLERMGAIDDAARALRELTRRAPDDRGAWRARAELAKRRAAWSEALACYRRIAASDGADEDAARQVLALRFLVGTSDPVRRCDARSTLRSAICR